MDTKSAHERRLPCSVPRFEAVEKQWTAPGKSASRKADYFVDKDGEGQCDLGQPKNNLYQLSNLYRLVAEWQTKRNTVQCHSTV